MAACGAPNNSAQGRFPHPAVVQVDQPARHAQQHDAAAVVPAQAALRPHAVLSYVAAYGASQVATRHVLRPASQPSSHLSKQEVLLW